MNSMFKFVAPGVWGFKDPRTDQNGQQTARSRKRTRLRRQPNFLRIDWRKSGYEDGSIEKNNTSRGRTQTTSESEEKDTSYSSSLSLEEQTSFRAGGKSAGSQPAASNLETCKKILLDFNKTLLNDVIERITEANKKCVERLISEMEAASTVTKTPAGAGEHRKSHAMVGKRNKQALQDTIDKLIANNEKCLMGLEKPVKEHRNLPLNYFETLLSTTPVVTVPCSSGLTQSAQQSSYTSAPVRTQKPIIPEEKTESVMLSDSEKPTHPTDDDIFSLPTLVKVRGRVNHHIKYGKRVIPKLTVDPAAICPKADSKIGDSEKDADSLSPMTTVSPSGASTRKILLAVDSSDKSPAKSDASQADVSQAAEDTADLDNCNSSTAARSTDRELSVNDAFVAYARTKSDLSDIVAMIDPNVSKSISLEKSQRSATDEKAACRQSTSSNKTSDKDPKAKQEKGDLLKTHPAEKPVVNSAREAPYSRNAVNILSRKRKADVGRSATPSKEVAKVKREDSPRTSAANGHQQIIRQKSVACSHASPAAHSVSAMRAAARAQAHASAQASSRSNGKGIEIRYMPPYRWRYGSNGVQQTRPSVNTDPRFLPRGLRSYQVVYPNASPSVYRNQASRIAMNSSLSLQRLPTLNDVHCRIRGATVLRMPVRK